MPPKFDPNATVTILLRVRAETYVMNLAAWAPNMGLSPKKVGEDIEAATRGWPKMMRMWVELIIRNRVAVVRPAPTTSNLIVQALREPGFVRNALVRNRKHSGNLSIATVIEISRKVRTRSMAHTLTGTVKEVLGSCIAVGCTVDGQHPRKITELITQGRITIATE